MVEIDRMANGEVKAALTSWAGLVPQYVARYISESFTKLLGAVLAGIETNEVLPEYTLME